MIIYTTSLFAVPLMLLVWAADTYVFLASIRLVLGRVAAPRESGWFGGLQHLTDGLPRLADAQLRRWFRKIPPWVPWATVILAAIVLRHLLIRLAVALPAA